MESLQFSDTSGVELLPGRCLSDIEYADPTQMQVTLNNINKSAAKFGMHFAPSKCYYRNLVLAGQSIEVVDNFICLGSCITPGGLIKYEVTL